MRQAVDTSARRELARSARRLLGTYLDRMTGRRRDEASALAALLAGRAELGQLIRLHLAAADPHADLPAADLDPAQLAGQLEASAILLGEAAVRFEGMTAILDALDALARSWDDRAALAALAGDPSAPLLRSCAAQLRQAIAGAGGRECVTHPSPAP